MFHLSFLPSKNGLSCDISLLNFFSKTFMTNFKVLFYSCQILWENLKSCSVFALKIFWWQSWYISNTIGNFSGSHICQTLTLDVGQYMAEQKLLCDLKFPFALILLLSFEILQVKLVWNSGHLLSFCHYKMMFC